VSNYSACAGSAPVVAQLHRRQRGISIFAASDYMGGVRGILENPAALFAMV
jgi:hypothetical protein